MLFGRTFYRFTLSKKFPFEISGYRRVSSSAFSKTLSVPFTIDKAAAQEAFKKHHSKHFLLRQPVVPPPNPAPVYLPYYVFLATATLTYSARLSNTTYERRYDFLRGRYEYYPRTRYYDIPVQTLSSIEYPATLTSLHVCAAYNLIPSWLTLDTTNILRLSGYHSLSSVFGTIPRVEDFTRPLEGVRSQVLEYLHRSEEERARKYLQRTYDPDIIKFTTSQLNYSLDHHQIFIPVWMFEFDYGDPARKYTTYVAGWNASTSGPVIYHPGLSAAVAGVLGAMVSFIFISPWDIFTSAGIGGFISILAFRLIKELPSIQKATAVQEIEVLRQHDRVGAQPRNEQDRSSQRQYQTNEQEQRQKRQEERPKAAPKYPSNDPQGLYKALEISPSATEKEVRDSFRRLALKYHPDRVSGEQREKEAAKEKFQQISAAYDILKDPRRRKEYDRSGMTSV